MEGDGLEQNRTEVAREIEKAKDGIEEAGSGKEGKRFE